MQANKEDKKMGSGTAEKSCESCGMCNSVSGTHTNGKNKTLEDKEHIFLNGILGNNPVFRMLLGLCPTLAVTTSVENSLGMGIATSFVLLSSSMLISALRNMIPKKVRIPMFITIISTFVTIAALFMRGFAPSMYERLGIYVPLIVVNCIIMARAESFASKNPVFKSIIDALGMGAGFTLGIMLIGFVRELLATGKIVFAGKQLIAVPLMHGINIFVLPSGAFLTIALMLAFFNYIREKRTIGSQSMKTSDDGGTV